jgi:hypothetical protein
MDRARSLSCLFTDTYNPILLFLSKEKPPKFTHGGVQHGTRHFFSGFMSECSFHWLGMIRKECIKNADGFFEVQK